MKRSEYKRTRLEHWGNNGRIAREEMAEGDARAVDALPGWTWDSEEPELPGKVTAATAGEAIWACSLGGKRLFALDLTTAGLDDDERRLIAALVATFNAWGPEGELRKRLEHFAGAQRAFTVAETLREILAKPWEAK